MVHLLVVKRLLGARVHRPTSACLVESRSAKSENHQQGASLIVWNNTCLKKIIYIFHQAYSPQTSACQIGLHLAEAPDSTSLFCPQ